MANTTWPPWEAKSAHDNLDSLVRVVETASRDKTDSDLLGWLGRLLVVRTSGYVELTVYAVLRGHVTEKSGGTVRSFAHSWLERSRNPTPEALEAVLGRFDLKYASEFAELLDADDQLLRRDLSFLVDRRNKIAHGENEGVRAKRALELVPSAESVADWFILRFNPYRSGA